MVQCNFFSEWYHTTCIKMDDALVFVASRFHCQDCVNTHFRGLSNFITYQSDKIDDQDHQIIQTVFIQWQKLSKAQTDIISSHMYPVGQSGKSIPIPIRYLNNKGIENPYNNCWMSSVIHVVCGTELFPLLPKEAEHDDDEEFKRKSSLFDILRTIAAALRDEPTSTSLQFGPDFVSLGRILNLDPSKGEQRAQRNLSINYLITL